MKQLYSASVGPRFVATSVIGKIFGWLDERAYNPMKYNEAMLRRIAEEAQEYFRRPETDLKEVGRKAERTRIIRLLNKAKPTNCESACESRSSGCCTCNMDGQVALLDGIIAQIRKTT